MVLWFAFVLWTIFDWYQLYSPPDVLFMSCDLLSFFELSLIDTNFDNIQSYSFVVVICFRSLNYLWLIPTKYQSWKILWLLWFAFVLWTIFDWYQHMNWRERYGTVVICFRSLNYLWLIPTFSTKNGSTF